MDDNPRKAAVADDEVGAAPDDEQRKITVVADPDKFGKSLLGLRLGPEPRGTADLHRGMSTQGLGNPDDPPSHGVAETRGELEFPGEKGGRLVDVPGPQREDQVLLLEGQGRHPPGFGHGACSMRIMMASLPCGTNEASVVRALDRALTGRIDRCHEQQVGFPQGNPEILAQCCRPGIPVGLEEDDKATSGLDPHASGRKRGPDFSRVMSVIVKNPDTVTIVPLLEPSPCSAERGQGIRDSPEGNAKIAGKRDDKHRVAGIVFPGDSQRDLSEFLAEAED